MIRVILRLLPVYIYKDLLAEAILLSRYQRFDGVNWLQSFPVFTKQHLYAHFRLILISVQKTLSSLSVASHITSTIRGIVY